ncbi:MAG: tyrosine-type recombinase/integrase [Alphaproteobacteria bacterium]|nr:tyrosine-type recombinase/integrase [Alphaproteobacteria bacterium]
MRHTGHIRQRSKESFEIRYTLGVDPLTGKRRTITTTFRGDKKSAEKELRRLLRSIDTGEYVEPTKIKVGEFLLQWLEAVHSQVSPKTHERYAQLVRLYLIPTFGACVLHKLSPLAIQNAYNAWETSGRQDGKSGGLAPRSRLSIHRVFKQALKHAVQLQLILRNPADHIKSPRAKKVSITTLTVEQSAILLNAIQGTRLYWLVLLALTTGMRRGEILALRWKNVDFDKKTVRIVESLEQTKKGIRFKAPKTERSRAVILPAYAVEQLIEWKARQAEELVDNGAVQTENTLVCAARDGQPLWPSSASHEFAKAMNKLPGLPRIRFHDLRHSHATQLLAAGIHPKIAQERLGHSTITTTLDLYSHVTDTMQDDAAAKLDAAFRLIMKRRQNQGSHLG